MEIGQRRRGWCSAAWRLFSFMVRVSGRGNTVEELQLSRVAEAWRMGDWSIKCEEVLRGCD